MASEETSAAVTTKFAVVVPAAIETLLGVVRLALLSDKVTVAPPVGAGCDNVTAQVVVPGVGILAGEHVKLERETVGARATVVFWDPPLAVAVTVALEEAAMAPAVAEKLAVVVLAATVTETGTVSRAESDDKATANPPLGAAFDSVTVQVETAPELRVEGAHVTLEGTAGALSVRVKFCVTPLYNAFT
ncbi:MAG: hypothetical protein ACKV22_01000 [Bryobacteraceae bacterium]